MGLLVFAGYGSCTYPASARYDLWFDSFYYLDLSISSANISHISCAFFILWHLTVMLVKLPPHPLPPPPLHPHPPPPPPPWHLPTLPLQPEEWQEEFWVVLILQELAWQLMELEWLMVVFHYFKQGRTLLSSLSWVYSLFLFLCWFDEEKHLYKISRNLLLWGRRSLLAVLLFSFRPVIILQWKMNIFSVFTLFSTLLANFIHLSLHLMCFMKQLKYAMES